MQSKRHGVGGAVALVGGACRPLEEFRFTLGEMGRVLSLEMNDRV